MNKYGPNSAEVKALIKKCKTVTLDQEVLLCARWERAWGEARANPSAANIDLVHEVTMATQRDETMAAQQQVMRATVERFRYNAAFWAVADAVTALCLRNQIPQETFNALYGPWKSVMETEE